MRRWAYRSECRVRNAKVGRALLDGAALYAERTEAEDPSRPSAKPGGARRRREGGRRETEKEKGKGKKGFE